MKRASLILISLLTLQAWAANPRAKAATSAAPADLTNEMDSLGANRDLMKKAKAIDPENRIRVVQNREVDRRLRIEIGITGALVTGGDAYTNTNILGGNFDFHINPRFSLGGRYANYANTLSSEGKRVYDDAAKDSTKTYRVPSIDYAKNSWLAVGTWYPVYGKLNLFDMGISQFDLYAVGGAGQIFLGSGTSPLYTAGGGAGIWLAQHFSTRLEARWQGYTDHPSYGTERVNRSVNETILSLTIGFLL